MPSKTLLLLHRSARVLTGLSALACAFVVTFGIGSMGKDFLTARIIREPKAPIQWKSFKGDEIRRGVNVPANTHIVFQMPDGLVDIQRETLLGRQGTKVRYWGYCLPQNEDEATISKRQGLPGLMFLSEAERAARARAEAEKRARQSFTLKELPTPEEVERENLRSAAGPQKGKIRHQVELFSSNMLCYLMTEKALSMGLDMDNDLLNDQLEHDIGSNPKVVDSDSDGIRDDIEYTTGTSPFLRDTDGDGLIDGIEDKNFNGRVDKGETDPRIRDSDRDDLCDGLCRIKIKRQEYYVGEDQNLNGKMDPGETDPLVKDTDGDGMYDEIEYMNCLLAGKPKCP
jgi:hypothetical protein